MFVRKASSLARVILAIIFVTCSSISSQLITARSAAAAGSTVVSLTFDDSVEDQYTNAYPALQAHSMVGTFYTITGYANNFSGYLTLPQLRAMYDSGNEIGSHTVLHPFLDQVTAAEQAREMCDSRNALLNWGFPVRSFAYPHSVYSSQIEQEASQCGYNSARAAGEIKSPYGCFTCAYAETIPPADPYAIRRSEDVTDQWSLQDIESIVSQTENNGGGWAILVFHHICENDCDLYSVSPTILNQFLTWLQSQPVSVRTVGQVIGGTVQPAVQASSPVPAPKGQNAVTNSSLENPSPYNSALPYCWQQSKSGTTNASFSLTSNARSGTVASQIAVTSFTSGAARLITKQDLGECAPSLTTGDTYQAQAYYKSTSPTRFVLWYRDSNGAWHYWTQSPQFPVATAWTQASWTLPAVAAGHPAASFGLDIEGTGTLTTDDYSLVDRGQSSSTLLDGLKGYWKFDEGTGTNASDSSGNGHTGTTYGTSIWTANGRINGGLLLNGSSNYVTTSYSIPTSGQITYSAWLNRADTAGNYSILGSTNPSGGGSMIRVPSGTNNIKYWRQTCCTSTEFSGVLPPTGTWCLLVLVDNPAAGTTTLYINGVSQGTNSYTVSNTTGGNLEVGGYQGTSGLFKGLIDEVGIWNRALTAAEVSDLWNGGAGSQYPFG